MTGGKKRVFSHSLLRNGKRALLLILLSHIACSGHGIYIVNDPLSAKEHNDLAVIYEEQGELELAIEHYSRAISREPENPLFRVNRGNTLVKRGDLRKGIRDYERALELDPDNIEGINNLCHARAAGGYSLSPCLGPLEIQLKSGRNLPWEFYDTAGQVYLIRGMGDKARCMFESALTRCNGCSREEISQLQEKIEALGEGHHGR